MSLSFVRHLAQPADHFLSLASRLQVNAETPGSIHEGGELGYALSVSYGSVSHSFVVQMSGGC